MGTPVLQRCLLTLLLLAGRTAAAAPEVELLTMGAGEDLYTRFGHTALRVRQPGSDVVYNFGYTNFGEAGLVWKFLRGDAVFWVAAQSFEDTLALYTRDDRTFMRQKLNLSPDEHAQLAGLLAWNAAPEHRHYRYHHFRDNCATRPRDLVDRVSGGELRRMLAGRDSGLRLRELMHGGFSGDLGVLLLSDLVVGRLVDERLSLWDACFLPRLLMESLMQVARGGCSGPSCSALAEPPETLYRRTGPPVGGDPRAGDRLLWLIALAVVALSAGLAGLARRRPRWAGGLLIALCLPLGLAALLPWSLALLTPLPELRWNENLLLLWPTDLLLLGAGLSWARRRAVAGRWLRAYAALRLLTPLAAGVGHTAGWLYQRPLSFLFISLSFGAGLLLACQALPRSRPAARTPEALRRLARGPG